MSRETTLARLRVGPQGLGRQHRVGPAARTRSGNPLVIAPAIACPVAALFLVAAGQVSIISSFRYFIVSFRNGIMKRNNETKRNAMKRNLYRARQRDGARHSRAARSKAACAGIGGTIELLTQARTAATVTGPWRGNPSGTNPPVGAIFHGAQPTTTQARTGDPLNGPSMADFPCLPQQRHRRPIPSRQH